MSPDPDNEAFWRDYLTRGASMERRARNLFKRIPSEPRPDLECRPLELKGKQGATEVVSLRVA